MVALPTYRCCRGTGVDELGRRCGACAVERLRELAPALLLWLSAGRITTSDPQAKRLSSLLEDMLGR